MYKWELYILIKFFLKYDYLYRYFPNIAIIYIDHKFLIYFIESSICKVIYGYWVDWLYELNIFIQYILRYCNRVVDGLLRTIF